MTQQQEYQFLFPFEKIQAGSRVLIYGAGVMGQAYYQQLRMTGYADCLGFVDREWKEYEGSTPPVYAMDQIRGLNYDAIVIALRIASRARLVERDLCRAGVPLEKICYIAPRVEEPFILYKSSQKTSVHAFAYEHGGISIAIRLGNGLGSAVIKKRFYEELVRIFPSAHIDLYSMMKKEDLQAIYGMEESLNEMIQENGVVYESKKRNYTLAFRMPSSLILDYVDYDALRALAPGEEARFRRLEAFHQTDAGQVYKLPNFIRVARLRYRGENCYTAYNCHGIFDIHDSVVHIPLNEKWDADFKALNLHRYITLNYGNGQSMEKESGVDKQWPFAYFQQFVELFKDKYPDVTIVQLGSKDAQKIHGVDRYLFGENLELIKYVLKHALFHLDIEGGLVHLGSQLGTKCIVLWGPTNPEFVQYDNNVNLHAGDCHGCWGLYKDAYHCARDMDKPACMYDLKPQLVMDAAVQVMEQSL